MVTIYIYKFLFSTVIKLFYLIFLKFSISITSVLSDEQRASTPRPVFKGTQRGYCSRWHFFRKRQFFCLSNFLDAIGRPDWGCVTLLPLWEISRNSPECLEKALHKTKSRQFNSDTLFAFEASKIFVTFRFHNA